ncbi:MAG: P-loop NTPase fold protein [Nitrospirota bacterium]|nr:P-loop NTPase fold protein [Nitrospirota bacterium]
MAYIDELKTDYAILINGEWGSGKTFFITNQLFSSVKNKYPSMRCVHISLNGLENLDEIYQKIVVELLSNQKIAGIGFGMLKTLLELDIEIPKIGLKPANIVKVLKNTSLVIAKESSSSPDLLLCFDDLERISSKTTIEAVLGYIYANFIERKRMKVLLISNEAKIESSAYMHGKEKIVGRTFLFTPSLRAVFSQILSEIVICKNSRERIETEKEFLLTLLEGYKIINLRTLQFLVRALHVICSAVLELKEETFHKVAFFTAILSFEYRKGTLVLEDAYKLNNFATMELSKSLRKSQEGETPSYEEYFYNTYVLLHRNEYEYFRSIIDLVFSGYFDEELFLSEIKGLEPANLSPEQEAKQKILHFRQLNDNELQKAIKEVSDYLLNGAYGIKDFLELSLFFTHFYDKGLISEDPKTILESASKILIDRMQDDKIKAYSLYGDIWISSEGATQTFREIRAFFEKSIKDKKDIQKRSSIRDFFSALLKGDSNAWVLYKDIESDSIFLYVDPEELASSIVSALPAGLTSLSELFKYRYLRITNIRDFHNNEIPVLTTLMNIIKERGINNLNDKPLRKYIVNELLEDLGRVIAHLAKEK